MRQGVIWAMVASLALALSACSTTEVSQRPNGAVVVESGGSTAAAPAPPDSPLSKIQLGMHKTQVQDILGRPSDENSYATGKVWIPFYFGNDARRTCWYYKGMGRVVFADGNVFGGGIAEVIRIDYDPTETGVAR